MRPAERLNEIVDSHPGFNAEVRGRGMFIGVDCENADLADEVAAECFKHKLLLMRYQPSSTDQNFGMKKFLVDCGRSVMRKLDTSQVNARLLIFKN